MKTFISPRKVAVTTVLALVSAVAQANTQALSLTELLNKSDSNPQIQTQKANVNSKRARRDIVESRGLPSLQFSGTGDVISTEDEQRSVSATLEQTVYDWGSLESSLKNARARLEAEQEGVGASETRIKKLVVSAYVAAQSARLQATATQTAIATASDLREVMQRRVDQRVDPASDLLLIESRIGQLESRVIQLRGAERDAQLNLLQLVGHKAQIESKLSCRGDLNEAFVVQQIVDLSSELAAAKATSRSIKAEFGAVDAKRLPAIVAGVSLTRDLDRADDDARAFLTFRYNYDIGDSLDAEVAELNADYSAAVFDEQRLAQDLVREASGLVNQFEVNADQLPLLQTMVELRQEQLGSYTRRFSSGKSSLLDLLNAESELLDARLAEVEAGANACFAILTLEQMAGRELRD